MRILVTGSRKWTNVDLLEEMILGFAKHQEDITIVHGGAMGADRMASNLAQKMNWDEEIWFADWNLHGRAAGPIRNKKMVESKPDLVLGFVVKGNSRGTESCINFARDAGLNFVVITNEMDDNVLRMRS